MEPTRRPGNEREANEREAAARSWVLDCGARYWGNGRQHVDAVADASCAPPTGSLDPTREEIGNAVLVPLPEWAADVGVDDALLVDVAAIAPGSGPVWQRCDWVKAAWLQLSGAPERRHEARAGPIWSYAFRLGGAVDPRRFDHAWVNRMFLLLRRLAARRAGVAEEQLFGRLPDTEIVLTHDVDALKKTPEIRAKQAAFSIWNAGRACARAAFKEGLARAGKGVRFALGPGDFMTFEAILRIEETAGLRSVLHFYGGPPGLARRTPKRLLLDPAYDIAVPDLRRTLSAFIDGGWTIGLHQSFDAWRDAKWMRTEADRVAEAAGSVVTHCRQHWLRFSWSETWRAQSAAGLVYDSTLGFNDRPGFRNGAALRFHPWDDARQAPMRLSATPMVFMDSHFYDYQPMLPDEREQAMSQWLDEVRAVRGQASVNWHTHTITPAYGWGDGYRQLVALLS